MHAGTPSNRRRSAVENIAEAVRKASTLTNEDKGDAWIDALNEALEEALSLKPVLVSENLVPPSEKERKSGAPHIFIQWCRNDPDFAKRAVRRLWTMDLSKEDEKTDALVLDRVEAFVDTVGWPDSGYRLGVILACSLRYG